MFFWSSIPFVRLVIPFGVGLFLSSFLEISWNQILFISVFFGFVILLLFWNSFNKRIQLNFWSGILISSCFVFLGIAHFSFDRFLSNEVRDWKAENNVKWIGEVKSLKRKGGAIGSFVVNVNQLSIENDWRKGNFDLLVFNRDSSLKLSSGDYISASGILKPVIEPKNPAQFNYRSFLNHKNIFLTTFEDKFIVEEGFVSLRGLAEQYREKLIKTYGEIGIEGQNLAVLVALTLGDKTYLDFELQKQYAGAGAMHILAVSGLHVGIIFLIFNFLLSKLPDNLTFGIIKSLLLLFVIWSFALLAGLSPSVQRASCMFSFVILSKLFQRNSNILNSIAVSAFFLMLLNPNVIFQVGFQLSYSAVIGIILIHPVIYKWVYCRYWLLDKAWSLLVISFAAQMATLPFTLAYFHQFPNYFLLSNLFVIPLAFATVVVTVFSACIFLVFQTNLFLGVILDYVLSALNYSIGAISQLPNSVSEDLWFAPISIVLIFVLLIFIVLWLRWSKVKYLLISLSLVVVISINEQLLLWQNSQEKQLVFYANSNPTFSFINGLQAEVYWVEEGRDYDRKLRERHLFSKGVRNTQWTELKKERNQVLDIGGKVVLFRPSNIVLEQLVEQFDYVILDKNYIPVLNSGSILLDYDFRSEVERKELEMNVNYINLKTGSAHQLKF